MRNQPAPLFAVLDASRDQWLLEWLNTSGERYQSLFERVKARWLAEFAPYLVSLPSSSAWLEPFVREGWGKHWGVYLTSLAPFEVVLAHVRQLLWVQTAEGKKLYFRFYDPRVLRVFVPTLTPAEQQRFVGPIRYYLMEDEVPERLVKWTPEPCFEELPFLGTQLLAWRSLGDKTVVNLRQEQIAAFHRLVELDFIKQIMQQLREKHLARVEALSDEVLRSQIPDGISRAKRYGLMAPASLATFVVLRFEIAFRFDEQVNIHRTLLNKKVPIHERMTWMLKGTSQADWLDAKQNYAIRRK